MEDWEKEDVDEAVPVAGPPKPNKWADEDLEVEVKDSWELSDDDDDDSTKTPPGKAGSNESLPMKKKKRSLKEIIAEKEAEKERLQADMAAKQLAQDKQRALEAQETPEERKARMEMLVRESDFENTKELFGGLSVQPAGLVGASDLANLQPTNKEEFDTLSRLLVERVTSFSDHGLYMYFAESLIRDLCVTMEAPDAKKVASTITALASEKQKLAKEASKPKKKAGAKIAIRAVGKFDTTNYEDDLGNEYDDFM